MKSSKLLVIVVSAGATALAFWGALYAAHNRGADIPISSTVSTAKQNIPATQAVTPNTQSAQLLYLIEEEKLAHDVYTVLYQTYGSRVFGNILESESTHQARVLTLLTARNIADPRSTQVGVFTDQSLQKLYDSLIAQAMTSAQEAYKVGVAIEEKDIADISKQLATASDDDVIVTLQALRSGSENHLRAFNRQL